jgi:hypothetical protein
MSTDLSPHESRPSEPFEVTKRLARELVRETGIDGVGVAVFATESTRDLVYASDVVAAELDETQFTLGEGSVPGCFPFRQSGAARRHGWR